MTEEVEDAAEGDTVSKEVIRVSKIRISMLVTKSIKLGRATIIVNEATIRKWPESEGHRSIKYSYKQYRLHM